MITLDPWLIDVRIDGLMNYMIVDVVVSLVMLDYFCSKGLNHYRVGWVGSHLFSLSE